MNIDYSISSRIPFFSPKNERVDLSSLTRKVAERASLCSAPSYHYWMGLESEMQTASQCREIILTLGLLSAFTPGYSHFILFEKCLERIHAKVVRYSFEGPWLRIAEILSQTDFYHLGLQGFLTEFCRDLSEEDFFGNWLKRAYKRLKLWYESENKPTDRLINPSERERKQSHKRTSRPIRKRGYNDHGSLPDPSKDRKIDSDYTFLEKERILEEKKKKYPLRKPKSRYYLKSIRFADSALLYNERRIEYDIRRN